MSDQRPTERPELMRNRERSRRHLAGLAALGLALGLLIWAKLQLVVSVPRSVIAVPASPPHREDPSATTPGTDPQTPTPEGERPDAAGDASGGNEPRQDAGVHDHTHP